MFKKLKLFSLFTLFIGAICFSQNIKYTDSLIDLLNNNELSFEERKDILKKIAYYHPELNEALKYAKQLLDLAKSIDSKILEAEACEEISHIERQLGNNTAAFEATFNALGIYESEGLIERQAASYNQLATNYMADDDYDLSIKYLKKAGYIFKDLNNTQNHALTILNLGEAYRLAKHLDSAETSFLRALELNKVLNNNIIQGYSEGNLGMVYNTQNKLQLAEKNLKDAISILKPLEDFYSASVYIAELGTVYSKEGKYNEAEEAYLEALTIAKEATLKEQIRDFSALLVDFYEKQKIYPKALEYQKLYQIYQDSLVNKENVQKIEQLKSNYEIDKRESEIEILNITNSNQRFWVIALTIGVSLLVYFAYLLYSGNKKIKTVNIALSKREQEKALLLRELNHRIKNNLQMISSLLNLQSYELTGHPAQEAIVAGKHRVEALSLVHRKLYQEDLDTRIELKEYIEELVLGLFHGYEANFKPSFKIEDVNVGLDAAVPLALVINEIIINALKYAYKNINNPSLKVIVTRDNNYLSLEIIDNGIGFAKKEREKSNSFGIKLIYSLIEQLEGTIQKLNSKNGTHWRMTVKLH